MLVLAHFYCTFPHVPSSTDRCIGIDNILGTFVGILVTHVHLRTDEVIGDKVAVVVEACEEEVI